MTGNTCLNCDNSGELLKMMDEVAQKAADRAADKVHQGIKLEMVQMEHRIKEDMGSRIDSWMGMKSRDHYAQHAELTKMLQMQHRVESSIKQRILTSLAIIGIVGMLTVPFISYKVVQQLMAPFVQEKRDVRLPVAEEPH